MPASDSRLKRFRFQGNNRRGVLVRYDFEAPSFEEARSFLRREGYTSVKLRELVDWHWSPSIWAGSMVAVIAVGAGVIWLPLYTAGVAVLLMMAAFAKLEQHRRARYDEELHRFKLAATEAHRAYFRMLEERRQREEWLLDQTIERLFRELARKREEEEITLLKLQEAEETMPDLVRLDCLRQSLAAKRQEIAALEAEAMQIAARRPRNIAASA